MGRRPAGRSREAWRGSRRPLMRARPGTGENRNRTRRTAAANRRSRRMERTKRTRRLPENRPRRPGREAPAKKSRRPTGSSRVKASRQSPSPKRPKGKQRIPSRTRPAGRKRTTMDSRSPGKGAAAGRWSRRNRRTSRGSPGGEKGRIRSPGWKRTAGAATRRAGIPTAWRRAAGRTAGSPRERLRRRQRGRSPHRKKSLCRPPGRRRGSPGGRRTTPAGRGRKSPGGSPRMKNPKISPRNRPNRNRLPMTTGPQTTRMGGITIERDRSI